jgi:subtilase family serine protease
VHGITSTSDRSTYGRYARQFQAWVDWTENTFIPGVRGAAFDLEPLDVNAGPAVIVAGTSTSLLNHLAANATNGAASGTWTYRVYLSANDGITSVDTLLSTQSYAWNFGAMSSVSVNMANVTIPANTPTGTYYLGVIYDTATDGNSGNNDSSGWDAVPITVLNVDLDVTLVSAPASARPGDSVVVSNTVQNIGNATSTGFNVGLYFSTDSTCTTSDTFLASRAVGPLGAGGASNANTPVTIPGGAAGGTRYICAIADRLSEVAEFSETNNTGFDTISIVSPDLSISVLTVPALASPGSSITVANTVFNGGTGPAGGFGVGLYLSTDTICTTGDTLLATRGVAGLAAGASSAANTPVTIPSGTPFSSRFVCAIADSASGVSESNEGNNSLARALGIVSSTPTVNLKINGIDAATVASTGAVLLTLDISPSTWTAPVDWYWMIVVGGNTYYVTAGGLSTTPAPLVTASPSPFTNATLLNLTLPPGTSMTNGFFLLNGATVVGSDVTTVNVAATSATTQQ